MEHPVIFVDDEIVAIEVSPFSDGSASIGLGLFEWQDFRRLVSILLSHGLGFFGV